MKNTRRIKKTVIITGAAGGIGSNIAMHFAKLKQNLIVNYYTTAESNVRRLVTDLEEAGAPRVIPIKADVSDRTQVISMFEQSLQEFGQIDILINCAGINIDKPFLEMSEADWRGVQSVILDGTFFCSQEFGRRYKGTSGHIINIGALTAIRGRKNGANYCSARAGVINLTKCIALELAPNIRVNCVTPGWIGTQEVVERYNLSNKVSFQNVINSIPMNRIGKPDDVSKLVIYLVGDSDYITGQNYLIDGGMLMY